MSSLLLDRQPQYAWLLKEDGPRMLEEFLKIYGINEIRGPRNNETIMSWAEELGYDDYTADSIPWCGLEAGIIAKRAGKDIKPVGNVLWARNWAKFGEEVDADEVGLGDILVFVREGGGHVGIYIGEDEVAYHVGGGNQSDGSNITRVKKKRCIARRRPIYNNKPDNVRRIFLDADGEISENEA